MSFTPKSGRDAWSTIAGFVLQVDFTILRWLNLEGEEILELECGEDIDTIQEQLATDGIDETRLMEQVKRRSGTLTLRAPEALEAMAHFCETRQANPQSRLSFRFVTTTTAGIEQGWQRDMNGISTWESVRLGDFQEQDRDSALEAIRSILRTATKPHKIQDAAWKCLQAVISSDEQLGNFITTFQWSVASNDYLAVEEEVRAGLVQSGYATDGKEAERLFERLFVAVFKCLRVPGQKRLTAEGLRHELEQSQPISSADRDLVAFIRKGLADLERRLRDVEEQVAKSAATIDVLSAAVTAIASQQDLVAEITFATQEVLLDVPDLVTPVISRSESVNKIIGELSTTSVISVVGEPGAGKTQLCLLVSKTLNRPLTWSNIPRDYSIQQACSAVDAMIVSVVKSRRPPVLRPWYDDAAKVLGNCLIVLDNLPRMTQGDPLVRRIELLGALLAKHGGSLLLISYYELPHSTGQLLRIGKIPAPRFSDPEITELLVANGAPLEVATKLTTLVSTATQGLPILVVAVARFFASQAWKLSFKQFESVLKAEFATNARHDAKDLVRLTVPDTESRELLYRLALTIGGFSRDIVARIARVPERLGLPNEKLDNLIGIWVQPFVGTKFVLSPLIDHRFAADLDEKTRRGVHATLAASILSQGTLEPLDVITAFFHFNSAGLVNPAAILLVQALLALTDTDHVIRDEWGIAALWAAAPLPHGVDLNLRLFIRALQVVAVDEQGKDTQFLRADLDQLLHDATETAWGTAVASSFVAIRLFRKYPALANTYLLKALRSLDVAILPDGNRIPQSSVPLVGLFWATAISGSSDSDVESWIASVSHLNTDQISALAASDLADNATILSDGVWHREYLAKGSSGDWDHVEQLVQQIEDVGKKTGLRVVEAAAIRTRIMILAEWRNDLPTALRLAESSLERLDDDESRFLITEVTGRQLSYAGRSVDAIDWLTRAKSFSIRGHTLWRRNVLITLANELGKTGSSSLAPALTLEAIEIARNIPPAFRYIEAQAEHSIALWNSGQKLQAYESLGAAVRDLTTIENDDPYWKTLLLALFQIAIYFSSLAYFGQTPTNEDSVAPQQGMFLGLGSIDITKYNPAQKCFIRIRMAMLAEGLGLVDEAGLWSDEALEIAAQIPDARTIYALSHLSIARALLCNDYGKVARLTRMMAEASAPTTSALARTGLTDPNQQQKVHGFFIHPATAPMAMLLSMVPVAFRLATLRLQGVSEQTIVEAIDEISKGLSDSVHQQTIVTALRGSLTGDILLAELRRRANELIPRLQDTAAGMIYMVGLGSRSSLAQALSDQVWLLQNVEKLFSLMPSARRELIYPFFVAFWTRAALDEAHQFRTADAYTRRSIEAVDTRCVKGIKQLLAAMSFCLGVTMPQDVDHWLRSDNE